MLKRLGIVAVTIVMVLAMISCGAKEKPKTLVLFEQINEETGYHVDLEMEVDGEMFRMDIQAKDDNFYADMDVYGEQVLMLRNADGFYMLMPSMKVGIRSDASQEMNEAIDDIGYFMQIGEEAKNEKLKTGEMELDGKDYFYEEYGESEKGKSARFLYEGDELKYMLTMDGDDIEEKIKIYALDTKIDESLFKVPTGYDITEEDF